MSRYIDADKTLAYISRILGVLPLALLNECEKNGIDIISCRECKYWSGCKSTMHNSHRCGRTENVDYWTRADDFCSYGEREGE